MECSLLFKEGDIIKHPKTGQILDVERTQTGLIEIISVNEKIAKANIIMEKFPGAIEYGQRVKSSTEASVHTIIQPSAGIKSEDAKQDMVEKIEPKRKEPVIPPKRQKTPAYITKYTTMLQSSNSTQKVRAAKEIFKSYSHESRLLRVVHDELLRGFKINTRDRRHVDAMAWLCKILGASGQTKYKATLEKIVEEAPNRKLKKYAAQSLATL